MSRNRSIPYQVKGILVKKLAIGKSRHEEKSKNPDGKSDLIHSWSTYNNYVKAGAAFGKWVKAKYKEKTVARMKIYVGEYLQYRIDQRLSAWTVALDASALAKLYGCKSTDFGVDLPKRKRAEVKRSRGEVKDFDEEKNKETVDFCKGTGLRNHELKAVTKQDVFCKEGRLFVHVRQGKGGKPRDVPVRSGFEKAVQSIADKCTNEKEKLFKPEDIPGRLPSHKYRAEYAKAQYEALARDVEKIPVSEKYICRKDKAGIVYDKKAMEKVSKMLGHNRISVIAESYLY